MASDSEVKMYTENRFYNGEKVNLRVKIYINTSTLSDLKSHTLKRLGASCLGPAYLIE